MLGKELNIVLWQIRLIVLLIVPDIDSVDSALQEIGWLVSNCPSCVKIIQQHFMYLIGCKEKEDEETMIVL